MKFSILICHVYSRVEKYNQLIKELKRQKGKNADIEIIALSDDGQMSVGEKRNRLADSARGEYVAFIDDDDWVSVDYIKRIYDALVNVAGKDVYCFRVEYSDGQFHKNTPVYYSVKYAHMAKSERNQPHLFYRSPNHLMIIRRDIVKKCPFPEINNGEDAEFERMIAPLIKSEHHINEVLYYYRFSPTETLAQRGSYGK